MYVEVNTYRCRRKTTRRLTILLTQDQEAVLLYRTPFSVANLLVQCDRRTRTEQTHRLQRVPPAWTCSPGVGVATRSVGTAGTEQEREREVYGDWGPPPVYGSVTTNDDNSRPAERSPDEEEPASETRYYL